MGYNIKMFSNPEKNLSALGLRENSIVADLGAGTGYYALAAGSLVPRGKIYAVELQKEYLDTIRHKVAEAGLKNVDIIWGNAEKIGGTKIGDGVADVVIVANILFQVENKNGLIEEAKRILKPKGKLFLSDWAADSILGKIAVPQAKARALFEQRGFVFDREIDTGREHYGMILRKDEI